jgi:hypothetical protein
MAEYEREYQWYLTGCNRLDQIPVSKEEFLTRWQEFEHYAEQLKAADEANTVGEVDAAQRAEMQARVQDDPFVQAILVGMAEDMPESGHP